MHNEIVNVTGNLAKESGNEGKSMTELVTAESLSAFSYLNGVINETLRLYAPAQLTSRTAAEDIVLHKADGSVAISAKKDDILLIPIYSLHHDEAHFPQPDAFRPERFIGQPTFHNYAYLPFGAGPRNCVAKSLALLEVKLALLHTVRKYKFSRCDQTKVNGYFSKLPFRKFTFFLSFSRYHLKCTFRIVFSHQKISS